MKWIFLVGVLCFIFQSYSIYIVIGALFIFFFRNDLTKMFSAFSKKVTNDGRKKINQEDLKKLNDYFGIYYTKHNQFKIVDNVYLCAENNQYKDVSTLNLKYKEYNVTTLYDYGSVYPDEYNSIIQFLLSYVDSKSNISSLSFENEGNYKDAIFFVDQINEQNNDINNPLIKEGLYESVSLLKQLSILENENSQQAGRSRKLYKYYLPMLIEICTNYKSLNVKESQEYKENEDKLIKTIILVNEAMKTLSSYYNENDYVNLSADIVTLQSVLKKDGLVKEGTMSNIRNEDSNHE